MCVTLNPQATTPPLSLTACSIQHSAKVPVPYWCRTMYNPEAYTHKLPLPCTTNAVSLVHCSPKCVSPPVLRWPEFPDLHEAVHSKPWVARHAAGQPRSTHTTLARVTLVVRNATRACANAGGRSGGSCPPKHEDSRAADSPAPHSSLPLPSLPRPPQPPPWPQQPSKLLLSHS